MTVPRSHPRYLSLTTRDRLVEGWKKGLVVTQGLIAHGRGEAFDYLLGETTTEEAAAAERASAALLLLASRPVISVNGNVGALSADEIGKMSKALDCRVEVNIFHRTGERVKALVSHLEEHGIPRVLGEHPDSRIPGLDHDRALCCSEGIFAADVVLVPLEDGDRCMALKRMGKKVITIDLNPLSRTSRTADITMVDNITRALPNLVRELKLLGTRSTDDLSGIVSAFDNDANLERSLARMRGGL